MTAKQKAFVDEYLVDLNATQAAIRAGYSRKTASRIAVELLTKTHVSVYLKQRMADRMARTEVTQDRVLKELEKIAFADITKFIEFKTDLSVVGYEEGEPVTDYKTIINMKDSKDVDGTMISEVSLSKDGTVKFKLHDKMSALEKIGKHLGMFTEKVELSGSVDTTITIEIDSEAGGSDD